MSNKAHNIDRYKDSDENMYKDMAIDMWLNNRLNYSISKILENKDSYNYAIEHNLVSKEEFLNVLMTFRYDLVIDSKKKVYAVFPSENINFLIIGKSYKKYKVTCEGCVSCINCYDCDTCTFCQNCEDCELCSFCNECKSCSDCYYTSSISNSTNIHFCKKVDTSHDCYYSYNIKNERDCYHSTDINHKNDCWFNDC